MKHLPTLGHVASAQARLQPNALGARDLERTLTFRQWNERACRLANGLLGLGLAKGDRVAVLAYNRLEWAEIYVATAKAGLVVVPINFRLTATEALHVVQDAQVSLLIAQDEFAGLVEEMLPGLPFDRSAVLYFGAHPSAGGRGYEDAISRSSDREPDVEVHPSDPWALMYTSGTTGKPKGAIRSHRGTALLSLVTGVEVGFGRQDDSLLVMPMCHANSLYFFAATAWCGGTVSIYSRAHFDPEHLLRTFAATGATFCSLVPTHYVMLLELNRARRVAPRFDRLRKLFISSAPAREETKRAVLEMFPNSGLFELYGSTEAGWVTMLHPHEQFSKLGSVGRECVGSAPIRLLDDHGQEVPDGMPGELFSCNPYSFDGYWNLPEQTRAAFRGEYCSVGDMARRDEDGYIWLLDRKKNVIITGGEKVYPSEVEQLIATHPDVRDVAVIGLPDDKWGERVHAAIVLRDGRPADADQIIAWCGQRIAGYKRPRSVSFLRDDEMPRTATGKVLHRTLRRALGDT